MMNTQHGIMSLSPNTSGRPDNRLRQHNTEQMCILVKQITAL